MFEKEKVNFWKGEGECLEMRWFLFGREKVGVCKGEWVCLTGRM